MLGITRRISRGIVFTKVDTLSLRYSVVTCRVKPCNAHEEIKELPCVEIEPEEHTGYDHLDADPELVDERRAMLPIVVEEAALIGMIVKVVEWKLIESEEAWEEVNEYVPR